VRVAEESNRSAEDAVPGPGDEERRSGAVLSPLGKLAAGGRRLDRDPRFLEAIRRLRDLLPGDSRFGDPLSVAGGKQSALVGRRLAELTAQRPGVLREAGLGALQVWQAISEAQGRGRGDVELTILFTDLVDFSDWAVRAGDEAALELLRDVGEAIEPPVTEGGGEVVKRLGDGMMAVFAESSPAVSAVQRARDGLAEVEANGYRPVIRAGIHRGHPRRIGGDYLGVDVNIAARIAEQAGPDELLVSDRVVEDLSREAVKARKKRLFRGKGIPKETSIYSLEAI
jgi:adenylate cyclase